jgi:beta-1,2-mannobiose phosphorylase / 1,2-beta-oligomannan phosphorylase
VLFGTILIYKLGRDVRLSMRGIRSATNPILEPNSNWWENKAVFNAAAVDHDGKVHMLYRAIGDDNVSRFGHAVSVDGLNFTRHTDMPGYESHDNDEYERFGCEDPRITKIDDTYYITYVGASVYPAHYPRPPFTRGAPWRCRVGLMSTKDFHTYEKHGIMLPDQDNKDVVLFPEKIRGRYAMMHRAFPDMWIAYSDNLMDWVDHKPFMSARTGYWDSDRLGAGAPPVKTERGWLEFYHGVDDDRQYHLGAVLLDLQDPSKIVARSRRPFLSPEKDYERVGIVPNVVFTCGLVERDDSYIIYYGGADKVMGAYTLYKEGLLDSPDLEWY